MYFSAHFARMPSKQNMTGLDMKPVYTLLSIVGSVRRLALDILPRDAILNIASIATAKTLRMITWIPIVHQNAVENLLRHANFTVKTI